MDDSARDLQEKLQAKRRAMDSTLQTSANTSRLDTTADESDDDDNIPILQDRLEEIDESEDADATRLKEKLESRHDATRRRLQRTELLSPPSAVTAPTPTKRKQLEKTVPKSPSQSQELTTRYGLVESIIILIAFQIKALYQ